MNSKRKKMKSSWEENVTRYPDCIGMTGRRPVEDEFTEIVKDLKAKFVFDANESEAILDIGCNNGFLLHSLHPTMKLKIGIDFSINALSAGHSLYTDIKFVQGEISELPFPNRSFARILCYNMYHYLPSIEAGLQAADEMFRVLKTSGKLLIGDIFTAEHQHLIPVEDKNKWNAVNRSFLHKMDNWMFMPIELLKQHLESRGATAAVLPQHGKIRCPGYRFDLLVTKQKDSE